MPFDGTNLAWSGETGLASALAAAGIEEIALETLEAHCAEEERRHPPSWLYGHSHSVLLAEAGALAVAVLGFSALSSTGSPAWGLGIFLIGLGFALLPMLLPVRGPARWQERTIGDLGGVHPVVRERAEALRAQIPDLRFRLGELFQERILLDPYLVAEHQGARILLGIWDGDNLIA